MSELPVPFDVQLYGTEGERNKVPGTFDFPPLRWGIMGAGRVCHDFVQAMKFVSKAGYPVAVGCRDLERSQKFASLHGIEASYGSYLEVAKDKNVEICYIGMLHPFHFETAMAALNEGKHVLIEKPMCCNLSDAETLIKEAKSRNLFLLEGNWTRFFPSVEKTRQAIREGTIGDVISVISDFGFDSSDVGDYPDHIFFSHKLGGGGLNYVAVYPIGYASLGLGTDTNIKIAAAGIVDDLTGIDMMAGITLKYSEKAIAVLNYNLRGETPEEALIVGTKGRIRLLSPAHCPTKVEIVRKMEGRLNYKQEVFEFPLPKEYPQNVEKTLGEGGTQFNYPNSEGFMYEIEAVFRCVRKGKLYCPQYTPEESLFSMAVIQEVRKQIGMK
mmetsp:Transcript_20327/g.30053  ORF Transcript_20327/g.30053 Transcript_20327/m.30053 type:complete len:384 (+) Transcript_20327:161-1312(+)|eukprot:CAMPEP_0171461172 /NCGR_PEP_ID=MMETSP0945-20130129/5732_1 /TAXON_ID=109269 /ORGANISM="Vaucheria litorea, Strain CCMP2940" /LENGTH=383 /DNA_ID=CAMNT_0011987477 /DNA_START=90 /DNA_END=1241 /DNA_ORIENTATION=+